MQASFFDLLVLNGKPDAPRLPASAIASLVTDPKRTLALAD